MRSNRANRHSSKEVKYDKPKSKSDERYQGSEISQPASHAVWCVSRWRSTWSSCHTSGTWSSSLSSRSRRRQSRTFSKTFWTSRLRRPWRHRCPSRWHHHCPYQWRHLRQRRRRRRIGFHPIPGMFQSKFYRILRPHLVRGRLEQNWATRWGRTRMERIAAWADVIIGALAVWPDG